MCSSPKSTAPASTRPIRSRPPGGRRARGAARHAWPPVRARVPGALDQRPARVARLSRPAIAGDRIRSEEDMADTQRVDVPDSWGLQDKVAIVTGGGAAGDGIGNGRAAAILISRAGTRVIVVDRDVALAKRTVEMIEAGGRPGGAVPGGMTPAAGCAGGGEGAVGRLGAARVPR